MSLFSLQPVSVHTRADTLALLAVCHKAFHTEHARQSHWARAANHAGRYCELCSHLIAENETMAKHDRRRHWPCRACGDVFGTSDERNSHGEQKHQWCAVHKRAFMNEANYDAVSFSSLLWRYDFELIHPRGQHMRSEAHVGRTHPCPCRCGRSFTDRAAVIQHLEAGTCSSGVTRAAVDQAMPAIDNKHFFTTDAASKDTS